MKKNITALSNHKFNTAKTTTAINLGNKLTKENASCMVKLIPK